MTDSMVSEDSPDFFRVPGIKVRSPRNGQHSHDDGIPTDIKNDPRFSNQPYREANDELAKNKGRSLTSTMTALVEQHHLPKGETRIHSVLFPNKMSHEQALVIDKYGDGLRYIEEQDRTGTALDGNIHDLTDMTGGRKKRTFASTATINNINATLDRPPSNPNDNDNDGMSLNLEYVKVE